MGPWNFHALNGLESCGFLGILPLKKISPGQGQEICGNPRVEEVWAMPKLTASYTTSSSMLGSTQTYDAKDHEVCLLVQRASSHGCNILRLLHNCFGLAKLQLYGQDEIQKCATAGRLTQLPCILFWQVPLYCTDLSFANWKSSKTPTFISNTSIWRNKHPHQPIFLVQKPQTKQPNHQTLRFHPGFSMQNPSKTTAPRCCF